MKILVYKMNVNFEQLSLFGFEYAIKIAYLTRSVFHSTFIDGNHRAKTNKQKVCNYLLAKISAHRIELWPFISYMCVVCRRSVGREMCSVYWISPTRSETLSVTHTWEMVSNLLVLFYFITSVMPAGKRTFVCGMTSCGEQLQCRRNGANSI